jgi:lipoprotein-anchoring transpeptidase ErfK/SrfK
MRRLLSLTAPLMLLAGCSTLPTSPTPGTGPSDRTVRIQIFLDQENFGPGVVDGQMGEFTLKARDRWLSVSGLPAGTDLADLPQVQAIIPYTTYTVTEADIRRIGTVASTVEEQAKQRSMPYRSVAEYVAERYHTTRRCLAALNPGIHLTSLQAGTAVRVPNVRPFRIEQVPETARLPRNGALAGRSIHIDTGTRMLEVHEANRLIATFPITPGSSTLPAPVGTWSVVGIATMPWYRHDEGVLLRGERTDKFHMIPAGPNSPVGILWMGLSKPGIGIHGTNVPDTIGRAASHGCIRLANWDADKMRGLVTTGARVVIR